MDALLCNGVGIYLGMLTCNYLEMKVCIKNYLVQIRCLKTNLPTANYSLTIELVPTFNNEIIINNPSECNCINYEN